MNNSSSTKPVGKFPDRLKFILGDNKLGSVAINNFGGGMFKGFVADFFGIDKSNTFFAITNNQSNDVWIHKHNCSVISWGDILNLTN